MINKSLVEFMYAKKIKQDSYARPIYLAKLEKYPIFMNKQPSNGLLEKIIPK